MRTTVALDATKLAGAVPTGSLGNAPATDLAQLEKSQALLAFKIAASNQLAKFEMADQLIDEYQDSTGIDAGTSTNESLQGLTTAKYFEGGTGAGVSGNYDDSGPDGDYTWYKWITPRNDGTFTTNLAENYEYLVVAGGGGGGHDMGGGGGAGGYRAATGLAVSAATHTIVVGDGGAGATGNANGVSGGNSSFSTYITSNGGGGGGSRTSPHAGAAGGSGGGGSNDASTGGAGNTPSTSPVQGYAGGGHSTSGDRSGGGGGSSAVGSDGGSTPGNGGAGTANDILVTGTPVTYAGGGGGAGTVQTGAPGTGAGLGAAGGGNGSYDNSSAPGGNATDNSGSGGGGATYPAGNGGKGGSGIVVIRRITAVSGADLTLQSNAATNAPATAPTTGDLVVLIDDGGSGTSAVQTNIKGFISRNGNFATLNTDHKQVTFVDEGAWGTAKQRILVARNVDISGITTGTSMKYRLSTHSQSTGTMETRIHATSLAWA